MPFTLATSLVAQKGPTQMAGHQICLEIWLAVSLLTDALAIAAQVYHPFCNLIRYSIFVFVEKYSLKCSTPLIQSLLATSFSQGEYKQAREILFGVLQVRFP